MSDMRKVAEKLRDVELRLTNNTAMESFKFFGLLLREDSDKWDLLVSATWLDNNEREGLDVLANEIYASLDSSDILKLSRIVPYPTTDELPRSFAQAVSTEHNVVEVKDSNFFGIQIREAYIITSKP